MTGNKESTILILGPVAGMRDAGAICPGEHSSAQVCIVLVTHKLIIMARADTCLYIYILEYRHACSIFPFPGPV